MTLEQKYIASTSLDHRKRYAQFFTPEKIAEFMGENALFAPPHHQLQRAGSVAYAALGKTAVDAAELTAVYLRKPQAEREREEKISG